MAASTVENWESVLSGKLDQYGTFRIILNKSGLRFASEPTDRRKIDKLLRNQPSGMVAIEGLPRAPFTPEDWEEISI